MTYTKSKKVIKKKLNIPSLEYDFLLNSPMIKGLTPEHQDELLKMGTVKTLKKGGLLFMAGDDIDGVYFLISGKLKEYYTTEAGEICLRRILSPGAHVSLHSVLTREKVYTYTCEVIRKATYFAWPSARFFALISSDAALAIKAASVLSCYIEDSCRLHCLCRKPQAVSRVAGYLLHQCDQRDMGYCCRTKGQCRKANIRPLEHTANEICLARETFSRALSSLQEKNCIRLEKGEVEILDQESLKEIAGIG